jgi:hypothetical protein
MVWLNGDLGDTRRSVEVCNRISQGMDLPGETAAKVHPGTAKAVPGLAKAQRTRSTSTMTGVCLSVYLSEVTPQRSTHGENEEGRGERPVGVQ